MAIFKAVKQFLQHFFPATEPHNNPQNTPTMQFLIVGLGNIGTEYEKTRHNIGFEVLDHAAKQQNASWSLERHAHKTQFSHKSHTYHLIKPTTFMNLSGKAVRYWLQQLKIDQSNMLVIVDDLALDLGKLRIRAQGSNGGHNGLKSIDECLNSQQYARFRFGIGNDFHKGKQVQFVLGKWSEDEWATLQTPIEKASEAIIQFGTIGLERTMNFYNTK